MFMDVVWFWPGLVAGLVSDGSLLGFSLALTRLFLSDWFPLMAISGVRGKIVFNVWSVFIIFQCFHMIDLVSLLYVVTKMMFC